MSTLGISQPGGSAGGDDTPHNPRRVNHIGRACDTCRRRHLKCDGGVPKCQQCTIGHQTCERSGTDLRRSPGAATLEKLETKIAELEAKTTMLESSNQQLEAKATMLEASNQALEAKTAALETSNKELAHEVNLLKVTAEMQMSLSISSDASLGPLSSSFPSPVDSSPRPASFGQPLPFQADELLQVPHFGHVPRQHRRTMSGLSTSSGSSFDSRMSSAMHSPHVPGLIIDPAPAGSWRSTSPAESPLPAFPATLGSPSATDYQSA
ncbi:hypothetical protein AURDEDRAFT_154427, partial [Auricularia subglabra TFB-10046 SS5]